MRHGEARGAGAWLAVAVLLVGVPSTAAPPVACGRVELTVVGSSSSAGLVSTVEGALGPGVVIEARRTADISLEQLFASSSPTSACLRAVVDRRAPSATVLVLIDDERQRYAVKRFRGVSGEDPLVWEEVGQATRTALDGLARGESLSQGPGEALASLRASEVPPRIPPPVPSPPPDAVREDGARDEGTVDVEAFVAYGAGFAAGGPSWFHGPRLGVALDVLPRETWRFGPMVDLAYDVGPRADVGGVVGRIDTVPIRLAALGGVNLDRWRIGAWLGAGLALSIPMVASRFPFEEAEALRADPVLYAGLRGEVSVNPDFGLFVDLTATGWPRRPQWVLAALDGVRTEFLSPWVVQPRLDVGARVF
ncbi:MAG: hypothetical protein AAF715_14435 [Myxococcota bacterium]